MPRCGRRSLFGLTAALCLRESGSARAASQVRIQLLVARSSKIESVSLADLRQLYRGRAVSLGGGTAIPFNHPPRAPDRVGFDRLVLGMEPEEIARYWIDQKIRGGDSPPRTVGSVGLLLRVLSHLPGAIGYVREGFSSPDLKVLAVDGRMPGDPSYALVYGA